jgi:acyl-CoA reductase-like NAD-dependent aldehyde dehydrogenase
MRVADGFEPGTVIRPLIDMKAVEKAEEHIADALKKDARVVTAGKRAAQGGALVEPPVLADVTDRHGHHQGGDLWPRRPALPLQERGGRNHA